MSGRTIWLAKDADWWQREWIIALGEEFGPAGPAVIDWLECAAKRQHSAGYVKAGLRALARGVFTEVVTVSHVLSRAVTLGLLVDYEERDGIFTGQISWWDADQTRALDASRQRRHRAKTEDSAALSRSVTESHINKTGQDHKGEETSTPMSATPTDVDRVFEAWLESTGKTGRTVLDPKRRKYIKAGLKTHPVDELIEAVQGWKFSAHHRGENDRRTVYNGIHVLLRDPEQIEMFRDLTRKAKGTTAERERSPEEMERIRHRSEQRAALEAERHAELQAERDRREAYYRESEERLGVVPAKQQEAA